MEVRRLIFFRLTFSPCFQRRVLCCSAICLSHLSFVVIFVSKITKKKDVFVKILRALILLNRVSCTCTNAAICERVKELQVYVRISKLPSIGVGPTIELS